MADEAKLTRLCGGCSTGLPDGAKFCPDCGAVVDPAQESMGQMLAGFASGTAAEIRKASRPVLASPTGRKVAAGAAIGAVAAVAIPFVSIGVGALVGAGVAVLRRGKSA